MVNLQILASLGISAEGLKGRFAAEETQRTGTEDEKAKVQALINRIRSREDEGISRNLQDWQWIYALDKAWDTPFHNFHPRLIQDIFDRGMDSKGVTEAITSLGLTSILEDDVDSTGKKCKRLNYDKFQILVHLVKSYTTMRWAKITNDRRLIPYLKYDPAKQTTVNRAKCEVLTDRIQVMSVQYGYFEEMKQAVLKMLQYSYAIQFIREEWDFEEQVQIATKEDVASGKVKYVKGEVTKDKAKEGDEILVRVKEGLRYKVPHPSRVYRDLAHPLHTMNTDSGITYFGYWGIERYGDVAASDFWNKDKIMLGASNMMESYPLFFQTVYAACQLKMPVIAQTGAAVTGTNDREQALTQQWYSNDYGDQGVKVTNHFEKLIPKENGLGDYPYPVWFRFVLAGDGCTVLYAAPLPSIPGIYYGYEADEAREKNSSMVMELLPFQYQFENMLSQIILSCKQNLFNLTLVDTDVLDDSVVAKLRKIGNELYEKLNVFSFSAKKATRAQNKVMDILQSHSLPRSNIAEMVGVLNTILTVMERMIGASAQEVGQSASHELRAEEVRNMASSTSTRVVFTATPVDLARDAQKRQLYAYTMAYGDDDFYGHIPAETELTKKQLEDMGFTYVDDDALTGRDKQRRVRVNKKAVALPLHEFSATRDGDDRQSDAQIATVMATFARDLMQNPLTAQAIGPDQAIDMANKIAKFAGIPEFRLRNVGQQQAQEQLKQVIDQVLQMTTEQIKQGIAPLLEATKLNAEQTQQNSDQIAKLTIAVSTLLPPTNVTGQSPAPIPAQF